MKDLAGIDNTLGAFPNVVAQNASGAGATDGTPYIKEVIDNLWGQQQALMDYAGLVPDGVTEAAGTAQILEAISKGFAVGPGFGVTYWADGDPAANGDRVLLLTGQGILRANYLDLDLKVYVGDGNNAAIAAAGGAFYHADDAAGTIPNPAGAYLIMPDTRGRVLRGWDVGAIVDPAGASRVLGDLQADAFQGHLMEQSQASLGTGGVLATAVTNSGSGSVTNGNTISIQPDGVNGTPRIDSESRMANTQTKYGITY